jgi:hypothetical protein
LVLNLFLGSTPRINGPADFRILRFKSLVLTDAVSSGGRILEKIHLGTEFYPHFDPLKAAKSVNLNRFQTVSDKQKVKTDHLYKTRVAKF